ncbi:trypsin-like peptidase [Herbaspirillum sp. SJZ107]|nr:trypsin-like peptidase [Herbaspirillum sp. SJZ107]
MLPYRNINFIRRLRARVKTRLPGVALLCAAVAFLPTLPGAAQAADLTAVVPTVKRSVVGVGTFERTRSPATVFVGTGFVVGDGLSVITNSHVVPATVDSERMEQIGIVTADGDMVRFRPAQLVARDAEHDLAHLRLTGTPLPALELVDSDKALEGQALAFTGYPLGMVLGLHAATHRATLAAITPVVTPSLNSRKLDVRQLVQLQRAPFNIFQLDATAYPGNSGSPLYDPASGKVWGVINAVFVKGLKESAITNPSGITYAVPGNYVRELLQQK